MKLKTTFFGLLLLLGSLIPVWSQDTDPDAVKLDDYVKTRTYFGAFGVSSTIDQWGDFNGTGSLTSISGSVTTTNPETDFIPSITRQFGWAVMVGHREGPWAAEVSFWRTDHTGSFIVGPVTLTTPASLQAINIDFKRYFLTRLPVQPFVSLGISLPWLWVHNFSFISDPSYTVIYSTGDETISGIGMNLGAGLEVYLDKDNTFSVLGGAYQRWGEFDQINGAAKIPLDNMYFDGNSTHVGSLAGNGLNFFLGGSIGFE